MKASKYISENGKVVAKIMFDEEYQEFQVKVWIDRIFQKDATYFTDDIEDAVATAKTMVSVK